MPIRGLSASVNEQKLREHIEILIEDDKAIRRMSSQKNRALWGEITRLEGVIKSKDDIIAIWLRRGEVWDEERARLVENANDVTRRLGEEIRQLKDENQRLLQAERGQSRALSFEHDCSDSNSEMEVSALVWRSPTRTTSNTSNEAICRCQTDDGWRFRLTHFFHSLGRDGCHCFY